MIENMRERERERERERGGGGDKKGRQERKLKTLNRSLLSSKEKIATSYLQNRRSVALVINAISHAG